MVLGVPLLTSIAVVAGWRGAFLVLAGVALASACVLWSVLPRDAGRRMPAAGVRSVLDGYALLLRDRPSLGLIGSALLSSGGIWAGWTYLADFYVDRHDFTTLQVGWVFLGCGLAGILGQLAGGGRLGARPRLLAIVGRGGCSLLWGAALVLPLPAATAVGLMVTGQVLFSLSLVGGIILLAEATPAARATALTLHGSALSFGTALGGALGGLVLLWGSYPALGYGSLALLVAAAGVAWWSRPCEVPATVPVAPAKA